MTVVTRQSIDLQSNSDVIIVICHYLIVSLICRSNKSDGRIIILEAMRITNINFVFNITAELK